MSRSGPKSALSQRQRLWNDLNRAWIILFPHGHGQQDEHGAAGSKRQDGNGVSVSDTENMDIQGAGAVQRWPVTNHSSHLTGLVPVPVSQVFEPNISYLLRSVKSRQKRALRSWDTGRITKRGVSRYDTSYSSLILTQDGIGALRAGTLRCGSNAALTLDISYCIPVQFPGAPRLCRPQ